MIARSKSAGPSTGSTCFIFSVKSVIKKSNELKIFIIVDEVGKT